MSKLDDIKNNTAQMCAIEILAERDMPEALVEAWKETTTDDAPESHKIAFKVLLAMMQQHTVSKAADGATLELMWLSQVMDIRSELTTITTPAREFDTDNVVDFMPHLDNKTMH